MNWKQHASTIAVLATVATCASVAGAQDSPSHGIQPPVAKVTFPEDESVVEIPFEFIRNKITIPVSVNGSQALPFVLDTGAPVAVLKNSKMAEALDLEIVGKARIGGAGEGETVEIDLAGNVSFAIGNIEITGGTMAVGLGETHLSGSGFEGVIGGPVFKNLVVDVDFANRILRLYPPDKYAYSGDGQELPIELVHGSFPYVTGRVSVDGAPPVETSFVIDTGAGHALMLMPDEHGELETPERTVSTILGWGANGVVRGELGRVTSLELGDYRFEDVVTSFPGKLGTHALPAPGEAARQGNIGARLLSRFRVVFDYSRKRMILEPNGSYGEPFPANNAGLMPKPWDPGSQRLEVVYVMDDSPATDAGIEVGDSITAINGKPVSKYEPDEIGALIEQDPGTKLALTIQRGDQRFERTLTLRRLI